MHKLVRIPGNIPLSVIREAIKRQRSTVYSLTNWKTRKVIKSFSTYDEALVHGFGEELESRENSGFEPGDIADEFKKLGKLTAITRKALEKLDHEDVDIGILPINYH